MTVQIGAWDVVLLCVVSVHATILAYLRTPRMKALLYGLPVPFTLAVMALGKPIDGSHVIGLLMLPLYPYGVRWLRHTCGVPIIPAIGVTALGYGLLGMSLVAALPTTERGLFWLLLAVGLILGMALNRFLPQREELPYRSPLPVPVKLVVIAAVIACLILLKQLLQGVMAFFPMVGIVAAYEARHSLWTLGRQVPVLMVAMVPMLIVCRLGQPVVGLGPSLLLGWLLFLPTLTVLTRMLWRDAARQRQR